MAKRLLLISNSVAHGQGYLDHVEDVLRSFLGEARRLWFVPFALHDWDAYAEKAGKRLQPMGYEARSVHRRDRWAQPEAIFIGGGNTFRLLTRLYEFGLLELIRREVDRGVPYVGASAGAIVAGPSLKTTKDMPVMQPPSFDALGLVPFHISPHYLDPDPNSTHMGETQEERISQFLEENDSPVVGLREGGSLLVRDGSIELSGSLPARIFRRGEAPLEREPGNGLEAPLGHSRRP